MIGVLNDLIQMYTRPNSNVKEAQFKYKRDPEQMQKRPSTDAKET